MKWILFLFFKIYLYVYEFLNDIKCLLFCRVKELGLGGSVEGKLVEIVLLNNINFGVMSL